MLTWNPRQGRPADISRALAEIAAGRPYQYDWRVGNRKKLLTGSRFFLVRQGVEPRGVIASGYTTSEPYPGISAADNSNYCDIVFTMIIDDTVGHVLGLTELITHGELASFRWDSRRSGVEFTIEQATCLESIWASYLSSLGKVELQTGKEANLTIILLPELEQAINQRAKQQGTTVEQVALDILRNQLLPAVSPPLVGGNLADFLSESIGSIQSSEKVPGGAQMSVDTGKKFAAGMVKKQRKGRL